MSQEPVPNRSLEEVDNILGQLRNQGEGNLIQENVEQPYNATRTRANTLRTEPEITRSRTNTLNMTANAPLEAVPMDIDTNATLGGPLLAGEPLGEEEEEEQFVDADEYSNNNNNTNTMSDDTGASREAEPKCDENGFYSMRLTPFIDHSSSHPHMFYGPIMRKIKPGMTIAMGRYTERTRAAATAAAGSSEMVVFKSKVVSRQHAELSVNDLGQWFIKDVKSSSGTFVNHVRLSVPNEESRQVALSDGDVIQLGVDYRGGSEDVFRCVRVRIEVNGSWRRFANQFTQNARKKLKNIVHSDANGDAVDNSSGDDGENDRCSICLDTIGQCQALFVSPCSHWWHYACIRPLMVRSYPHFTCPNCKAPCHLEADIEDGAR